MGLQFWLDIHDFGEPCLSICVNKKTLTGPVVLQLSRYRNVSQPKLKEGVCRSDDVARVSLTDGHTSVSALILENIRGINADSPPGVKLLLSGVITLENGFFILTPSNVTVIGGRVEKLYNKWIVERHTMGDSQQTDRTEYKAPRWISFGKSTSRIFDPSTLAFKANDVLKPINEKAAEDGSTFEQQRKNNIDAIGKGSMKVFIAPKIQAPQKLPRPKPNQNQEAKSSTSGDLDCHKKKNTRRHARGHDEKSVTDTYAHSSKPSTLFDFMAASVSLNKAYENPAQSCASTIESVNNPVDEKFPPRKHGSSASFKRSIFKESNHRDKPDLRNGGTFKGRKYDDRDRVLKKELGFANNINTSDLPLITDRISRSKAFSNITSSNSKRLNSRVECDVTHDGIIQKLSGVSFNNSRRNEAVKNPFVLKGPRGVKMQKKLSWKVGDHCMAPWNDGMYYLATVVNLGASGMCDVRYNDYGDICTFHQEALLPKNL
ncbi:hypothetical protein DICVIV_02269 [Dictyocaulus viviparus]|uniref:Tudor domain-containing protein n=1 Tax=Dictyocaulus viviparus TaxID=29172 RepID=A0A0D8Y5Q9_DICVI|nr:hypothetical protein DICVIV_02269 [Dictyocaulus viviparus]